jgi:hypothetical protein
MTGESAASVSAPAPDPQKPVLPPKFGPYERGRRRRKIVALSVLSLLLLTLLGTLWYFNVNRSLPLLGLPTGTGEQAVAIENA